VKPALGLSSTTYDGRVLEAKETLTRLARALMNAVMHERRGRRRAGCALAAVLVVGWALVQAAWLNPTRLLVLEPLSDETVTLAIHAAAAALAVAAMLVGLRRPLALSLSTVVVSLSLLVAGVVVVNRHLYSDAEPGFRQTSEAVAATSPDGRFEVVTTVHRGDGDADFWYEEYHVESRAGLWSRRSDFLAVLHHPLDDGGPRVGSVRFGDGAVELSTSDGRQWTIPFDPDEVQVSEWLSMCDDRGTLCQGPLPVE
jgi:hypothetical protein